MDPASAPPGHWRRLRLGIAPWAEDVVVLFLMERGVGGLEVQEASGITWLLAHLPQAESAKTLESELETYLLALESIHGQPVRLGWEWEWIPEVDWQEIWKVHFHRRRLSRRFVVKPSWETYETPQGDLVLEIDPGQAFGTGLHATTRMCVAWIDDLMEEAGQPPPARALDLGTGTGILAIALAKTGVEAVWALDNDPVAAEAARLNARRNGVEAQIRVVEGELEQLGQVTFPFVVANLTGATLVTASEALCMCIEPGGRLLVSGILADQSFWVGGALEGAGFRPLGERQEEEWCSKLLVRGD